MGVLNQDKTYQAGTLGKRVDRAAANLPQTADVALFNITGGRVQIREIIGEVTTVIQNQANDTKIKFNPDEVGADVDLCAALDIANDAVGTLYGITGSVADAMVAGLNHLDADGTLSPIILSEGAIELNCAASNTGQVSWTIFYVPIDDGAAIVAA